MHIVSYRQTCIFFHKIFTFGFLRIIIIIFFYQKLRFAIRLQRLNCLLLQKIFVFLKNLFFLSGRNRTIKLLTFLKTIIYKLLLYLITIPNQIKITNLTILLFFHIHFFHKTFTFIFYRFLRNLHIIIIFYIKRSHFDLFTILAAAITTFFFIYTIFKQRNRHFILKFVIFFFNFKHIYQIILIFFNFF